MFVGVMRVEIFLPGSNSLKAKRRIINSIKGKIRSKYNVGISEIEFLDKWQHTLIGIVGVSNDSKFLQSSFNKIVDRIKAFRDINVLDWSIRINNEFKTETGKFVYNESST